MLLHDMDYILNCAFAGYDNMLPVKYAALEVR
jgi:hypothetical protein